MARSPVTALALSFALALQASAEAGLPETQLPLRLIGTVVSGSAERSLAVIENGGETALLRAGDAISGATVHAIHKNGIVLDRAGRLEHLAFAAPATGSGIELASDDGSADIRADRAGNGDTAARRAKLQARSVRRTALSARARARRSPAVPASADVPDELASSGEQHETLSNEQLLLQLSKQARYAPLLDDDGKLRGVALIDVRPDSTLERLGLRNGDVVVSVAGVKVDNTSKAYDALRALNPRAGGEVVVERRGVPTRISIAPGAL